MKRFLLFWVASLFAITLTAQPNYNANRQQENINRSIVAVNTDNSTTFVSWSYLQGDDAVKYRLYRNNKLMVETKKTNHTFPIESAATDLYYVEVVDANGQVIAKTDEVTPWAFTGHKITLQKPDASVNNNSGSYTANDCSVGDVDGDGEYEVILKWDPSDAQDNSKSGKTSNVVLDCYKLDGTRLWSINLGPNIRAGAHYTQFLVYDFDGDGKAEMICKTAPWSSDSKGNFVNQVADDVTIKAYSNSESYRNSEGRVLSGPEFLTVFKGETGEAVHTIWYNPNRAGGFNKEGSYPSDKNFWGDNYGNRSDRFNACVAFLDGEKPSAVFNRGYYTRSYFWAVDYNGGKLVHRWLHASVDGGTVKHYDASWNETSKTYSTNTSGISSKYTAYGNGNHNLSVGDVDGDGKDEIIMGSCAIDDDGQLLYATGFGHGDAIHLGDLNPDRPGLELFQVHEEKGDYSWDLHDAATGEILFKGGNAGKDNGRGLAADLIPTSRGYEFSSSDDRNQRSSITGEVASSKSAAVNFRVYWAGEPYDQTLDGGYSEAVTIGLFKDGSFKTLRSFDGLTCNTTKRTPNLVADIIGDWREEVILHDDNNLIIYSTTEPSNYNVPSLMTDPIYRLAVAWQNSSYNQPPHLGYYLADHAVDVSNETETLYYDPEELSGQGVEHTEVANGDITWVMGTGTADNSAIAEMLAPYFSGSTVTPSAAFTVDIATNKANQSQTTFQPAEKESAAGDNNAIDYLVTLKDGYEFQPQSVSISASRYGTNGGQMDVKWVDGDGSTKALTTAQTPERSADESGGTTHEPYYTTYSYTFNNATATTGTFGVRVNIYGLANNKKIGLCNLIITGKVYSLSTGIATLLNDNYRLDAEEWYNLQGQKMENPSVPGVYIRGGKKVVVK